MACSSASDSRINSGSLVGVPVKLPLAASKRVGSDTAWASMHKRAQIAMGSDQISPLRL